MKRMPRARESHVEARPKRTTAEIKALARVRQQKAVEMRLAGYTWQAIADTVGYRDAGSAYKAYELALSRALQPVADDARNLELDRLDALQQGHWLNALHGDTKAAGIVLQCIDRRARLLGLDAPTRVQVSRSPVDEEIERLAAELQDRTVPGQVVTAEVTARA